jgi:hypothetical protein
VRWNSVPKMNGLSAAARPTPPPPSSSVITSLTSRPKPKRCTVATTNATATTSLAEALATSVADLVCESNCRKFISGSTATAAAGRTALGSKRTQQHTTTTDVDPSATCATATHSIVESSSQPSPPVTSAPRSSMSSAVADLASGMSIFQPVSSATAATTTSAAAATSSFQTSTQHRNYHYSSNPNSAPIISGTAAAVLALQSASLHDKHSNYYYDNIVSSNSANGLLSGKRIFATKAGDGTAAVENNNYQEGLSAAGGGGVHVPNPLRTTLPHSSPQGQEVGDAAAARSVSSPTITTTGSYHSPTSSNNNSSSSTVEWTSSSSLPKFPTRYPDGAPIIAGTAAAAQIEANFATATAKCNTRLLSTSNIDDPSNCGIINAVTSLGPCGVGEIHQSHGFSSPREDAVGGGGGTETEYHYWSGSTIAPLTITTQGSNALSWMDHGANYLRVTPEDGGSVAGGYSFNSPPAPPVALVSSSSSQHYMTSYNHDSHAALSSTSTTGRGGGMDILAEITCHAPPMILPTDLSHDSTSFNAISYPPQNSEIIPDQESYHHALPTTPASPQGAQYSQAHQYPMSSSPINNEQQRISIIPSYQEIYREMGIPHQHSYSQRPQHSAHNFSTSSYSVEEIEVDACQLSQISDHHHLHQHQQQELSHVESMDPTISQPLSRMPTLHFGQVNRDNIEEGKELYTRKDLYHFGGHASESKDVHGNMKDGCDSLVIGNLVSHRHVSGYDESIAVLTSHLYETFLVSILTDIL